MATVEQESIKVADLRFALPPRRPAGADAGEVLRAALEQERVVFVPDHAFAADDSRTGSRCMHLNFSHSTPEMIETAGARLARGPHPQRAASGSRRPNTALRVTPSPAEAFPGGRTPR